MVTKMTNIVVFCQEWTVQRKREGDAGEQKHSEREIKHNDSESVYWPGMLRGEKACKYIGKLVFKGNRYLHCLSRRF